MSTNNFTVIHLRDFVTETGRDPARPGYDSALLAESECEHPCGPGRGVARRYRHRPYPYVGSGFCPESPTNRRAPTRQRSPLPPSSQDAIESPDSISQASQRVPDIMKKTWKKKPRTGFADRFKPAVIICLFQIIC